MNKNPSVLQRGHLAIGVIVLAAFVVSGLYLRYKAPSIYLGDEVSHMMFRANHIYILMAGLVSISIGRYVTPVESKFGKTMQSIGLGLILAASGVLVYAFTLEPALGSMQRDRTTIGVVMLAAGTVLHVLSGFGGKKAGSSE
jgi:hypothetical protein